MADGWGEGELVFDGELLVHSELPRTRGDSHRGQSLPGDCPQRLAERLRDYFAGERDSFADVEIELESATDFQRAVTAALRECRTARRSRTASSPRS